MDKCIQMFIEKKIDELSIINVLNYSLKGYVSSMDIIIDNSLYFIQVQYYSQGFKTGLNISRCNLSVCLDETKISRVLAKEFNCKVLYEFEEGMWKLILANGDMKDVDVIELDDGIDVTN